MLTQQITNQVLQWIAAQAQAGHKQEAVLAAMRASGWHDAVAVAAVEYTKRGSIVELPPPVDVPDPDPTDSACVLHTSDREVPVLAATRLPRLMLLGSFLSPEECDGLMELA